MAAYRPGREAMYTNVAGLNAVSQPEYDIALQQQQQQQHQHPNRQPGYDFQADLDMFTNTQFFDLDMGEVPETNSPSSRDGEAWGMNGGYMGDRQVQNFNNYDAHTAAGASYPYRGTSSNPSTVASPSNVEARLKSDASDMGKYSPAVPQSLEEASRMAAEEDKRRRNTAASARFRVKKKQREQALEKAAKDMTDRLSFLENRVQTLEMENKLLKDLITEKTGAAGAIDVEDLTARTEIHSGDSSAKEREEKRRSEVKIESAETRR